MSHSKADSPDDYFRCVAKPEGWVFQVAVVTWDSPDLPHLEWRHFRTWLKKPSAERQQQARAAAVKRYFRTCAHCGKLCNRGHMQDRHICQSCAEEVHGVVY